MSNENKKADVLTRSLAALVDSLIAGIVSFIIPVVGAIIATAYILTKDAVMFELTKDNQWKNKSIGKRLLKIEVRSDDTDAVDWMTSVKRNITLSIGTIIGVIPILGPILGSVISFIISIIEIALVIGSPDGKRIGDRIADTMVVPETPTATSDAA